MFSLLALGSPSGESGVIFIGDKMDLDSPLRTLDIILDNETFVDRNNELTDRMGVLRANKTQLLMRSTFEECLIERQSILEGRGFRAPEDWELEWNVNLGPVWSPADEANLAIWLSPDKMIEDEGNSGKIGLWEDQSGGQYDFYNAAYNHQPALGTHLNGFKPVVFPGFVGANTRDFLYMGGEGEANQWPTDTNPGSGDRLTIAMMVNTGEDDNVAASLLFSVCGIGEGLGGSNDWNIRKIADSSNSKWRLDWGDHNVENEALTFDADQFFVTGTSGSNRTQFKVDGGTAQTAIIGVIGQDLNTIDSGNEVVIAADIAGGGVVSQNNFKGSIYEIILIESEMTRALSETIEGYFAHKYGKTSSLPSDHPYKTEPPRSKGR